MSIQFKAALKDTFKTEKKWMTILGLSVCMLIPVVGPMVSIGYLLRRFAREREGHAAEDFDFNHFAEYLKIGLWPVLATMLFSLILVPIIILVSVAPALLVPFIENENEAVIGIIILAMIVFMFLLIAAITVFTYPILLRSGLMMDFKSGFSWSFMKGFASKVGLSLIGYYFLLTLVATPLMLLGYLALIVGVYVVAAWMQVAMMHLVYQHYDLMIERGGERIEVNPELTKNYGVPPLPSLPGEGGASA